MTDLKVVCGKKSVRLCSAVLLSVVLCLFSQAVFGSPDDPPKVEIVTKTVRDGIANANYVSAAFEATGGKRPYTWTATGLPEGLSFGDSDIIHGKTSQSGNFPLVITVTDNSKPTPAKATVNLTLKITPKGGS